MVISYVHNENKGIGSKNSSSNLSKVYAKRCNVAGRVGGFGLHLLLQGNQEVQHDNRFCECRVTQDRSFYQ
jgi:hypothetical protein